ncbi:MAG: pantoate--beta-alanine ligase [Chloroflexota bacterium]
MKVIKTIAEVKQARHELKGTVGLFPTLGYLHAGHLSLVKRSRQENKFTISSIFINPTQFGPSEDFEGYPRDFQRDLAMLEKEGVEFVFMPSTREMYPNSYSTWVDVEKVTDRLEGATRPGHFRGVATIVAKLFNILEPTRAYFGQKDAQQVIVIKKMVADLNMNLEIVTCPTVREPDGLAMSSRNTYLKPDERKATTVLYQSLKLAEHMWSQGEKDAGRIRQAMTDLIKKEPLAEKIDYISIADAMTLEELDKVKPPALVSLVVKIGKPRLLDNVILE